MSTMPSWFQRAIEAPYRRWSLDVDGATIRGLAWGDEDLPPVVLVHGGLAHAHWWQFIAPCLADRYHLLALDLSGHGDSDHRVDYPQNIWSREVAAVCRLPKLKGRPVLVGHSMGGIVSVPAAANLGDHLRGLLVIDAPLNQPPRREPEQGGPRTFRHIKPYPDLETAVSRFRLLPEQPCENDYLLDFLARTSLREVEAGWIWKFDLEMFDKLILEPIQASFARISCPWIFFHGSESEIVKPALADYLTEKTGRKVPFATIPSAHHHVMLDQPLAFLSALETLLALWTWHD